MLFLVCNHALCKELITDRSLLPKGESEDHRCDRRGKGQLSCRSDACRRGQETQRCKGRASLCLVAKYIESRLNCYLETKSKITYNSTCNIRITF